MLLRFRVANYASLRDEQELSLVALDEHSDLAMSRIGEDDLSALPAVAIYGANASGKSNLLQALHFMAEVVEDSHQRWLPGAPIRRNSFRFDDVSRKLPSEFSVDIVLDGIHYEYGFAITDEVVQREWLYCFVKQQRRVRRLLFERSTPNGESIRFGEHLKGKKRAISELVRPNSLYLSAAAANNHSELSRLYRWFERELIYIDAGEPWRHLSFTLHEVDGHDKDGVLSLLNYADFGVIDVHQESRVMSREISERFLEFIRAVDPEHAPDDDDFVLQDSPKVDFVHRVNGKNYILPLDHESSGTRGWFALLGPIIHALSFGKLVVVDELDAYLHPLLVGELVGLFQDPRFNRKGAQLLFNTHDVTLLSSLTPARLRRDQVWLTDRTPDGATVLRPLTDYRVRDGLDSVFRGYLVGRYRGVPVFDDSFLECTLTRHTRSHGRSARQASAEETRKAGGAETLSDLL